MSNELNNKYVRQDVFNVIMKGIDEKLEKIQIDVEEIKQCSSNKNSMTWRLILIVALLALGGGGISSGIVLKLLEALAK